MTADVQANAWLGAASLGGPDVDPEDPWSLNRRRIFRPSPSGKTLALPTAPPDERNWRHPKVGWGLVLLDDDAIPVADKAVGATAPAPLKRLLANRVGSPVFYYRPGSMNGYLRRYFSDGRPACDLDVAASLTGVGPFEIPKYLLIYGSPATIPWRAQYALNMSRCVGRLDLVDGALDRYVGHLIDDWSAIRCDPLSPVVWSVNFGASDITALMEQLIADQFWARISAEPEFGTAVRLKGGSATVGALSEALRRHPGLVVTTSHGMTGPMEAPGAASTELGLLVDANAALTTMTAFPDDAIPAGAIWYAHACCSAGSDSASQYSGLFPDGHPIARTMTSLAANVGDRIAPLPSRLLAAGRPLRAFVGHVEPTFDWTLKDPFTRQAVGSAIADALYTKLFYKGTPIGLAFAEIYAQAGVFLTEWQQTLQRVNRDEAGAAERARYLLVAALDRQSMVLLGDPTVSLPLA